MKAIKSICVAGIATLVFSGSILAANAQRPDTRAFHCQAIHASIAQYKSLIMSYSNTQYERFVESRSACTHTQVVKQQMVPALDTPRCPLKVCVEKIRPIK